jgi:hypothetical protein
MGSLRTGPLWPQESHRDDFREAFWEAPWHPKEVIVMAALTFYRPFTSPSFDVGDVCGVKLRLYPCGHNEFDQAAGADLLNGDLSDGSGGFDVGTGSLSGQSDKPLQNVRRQNICLPL